MARGQVHEYELESFDSRSMRARARPRSREVFIVPRGPAAYPVPFHSLYRRAFGRDSERLPTGSGILIR